MIGARTAVIALLAVAATVALLRTADSADPVAAEPNTPVASPPETARWLPPFEGDDEAALARLADEIEAAIGTGRYARADWGVIVTSLDHGDTLYAHAADRPLAPASNMKVVTSIAALHHLGPDFRFQTWLLTDGEVRGGVLHGDLILYGTGDPGLGDRFYRTRATPWELLAEQLRENGIREVRGRVVGDGTFFTGPMVLTEEWEAEDLNEWYGAASGGLAYNENVASLRIEAGRPGAPPLVHSVPAHTGQRIVNRGRTVAGRPSSRISFLREDPREPIVVAGEIRRGTPDVWRQMTISDPALFAAHGLTHVLRDEGIPVAGDPTAVGRAGVSPLGTRRIFPEAPGLRVVAELRSPPLATYLSAVNQRSHNLFADMMLKALGRALEGQGSFAAGGRAVERFLVEEVGIPEDEVRVLDGSGLAAGNRLSARALVATLAHADAKAWWPSFWESLPEAGSRSLRRMSRTRAARNLRAKTGTISDVSALTGVVTSASGERLAFAIVGNDLPSETGAKRLVEDRIGAYLAEWRR